MGTDVREMSKAYTTSGVALKLRGDKRRDRFCMLVFCLWDLRRLDLMTVLTDRSRSAIVCGGPPRVGRFGASSPKVRVPLAMAFAACVWSRGAAVLETDRTAVFVPDPYFKRWFASTLMSINLDVPISTE